MALASIDLGGTNLAVAIGLPDGQILASTEVPTRADLGPAAVLGTMARLVRELAPQGVEAVGVGVPGLCDLERGETLFLPNLPTQWRGIPLAATLEDALGCGVYLLNDARMATLGELDFGHGRHVRDFAFFTLGTGIGGGLVIDGRLRLGRFGAAGEFGHQTVEPDGLPCGCGSRGCLELYASAPALLGEAVRLLRMGQAPDLFARLGGDLNLLTPALLALSHDPAISLLLDRAARYLAIGAANVALAFHPDLVVFGGGLARMGDRLLLPVRAELDRRVKMFPASSLRLDLSQTGPHAPALGGIALARRRGVI
ncbi:MAG: ROK family protein [Acidobacteriota bacterium]